MRAPSFFVSPQDLWTAIGGAQRGFIVYHGLYAWLRFAAEERHNWPAKAA
jgi:hypothetical protein